jgi:hypothetical protein
MRRKREERLQKLGRYVNIPNQTGIAVVGNLKLRQSGGAN